MLSSEEFKEKLCGAINAGFIQVSPGPDGLLCYSLTEAGLAQWKKDSPNGGWRKMEMMMNNFKIFSGK